MAAHNVVLSFTDGQTHNITVGHGGNLLEAALVGGIPLLHQCKTGSCSTCVCKCTQGDLRVEANTSIALLPSELAIGQRLACVTKVYSDGTVELPYPITKLDRDAPHRFDAAITQLQRLNDTVLLLTMDAPDAPEFDPGAYFTLQIPGQTAFRAYSPSSWPKDLPKLEFLIRLQPNGAMSKYLSESASIGDVLHIEGPFGEFRWTNPKNPIIFVAGGTGLAPILSMLRTIAAERRHHDKILLCFGLNRHSELFYEDELAYLQEMMPRLEVRISVGEPHQAWTGATGHVTDLIKATDVSPATKAFLCGPPPMVSTATNRLKSFGVPESSIMFERFAPA